ncbi:MAG TPA: C4-dicarboxylate ABC transporter [Acidobacteriota bacterium]|nr:C4-dicarboxylate ABC transporter [Acidobacteriota bacterium]
MNMFASAGLILGVMVAVYLLTKLVTPSTELSMLAAAIAGALAGGYWIPSRHIAEGAITYLDINLIFVTATFFMAVLKESGGVAFAVRAILHRFHSNRPLLLVLLAILLLIPGAFTGAGSVTVLITGGMVATVLNYMGVSRQKTAAIVFIIAGMSAAAPPVSLWAMLTAAGVNMPYVGFFLPLLLPCVIVSLITVFLLGWRGTKPDVVKAFEELPEPPARMNWYKVLLPFVILLTLMFMGRRWPHSTPIVGLPLMFVCAAAASYLMSPIRLDLLKISRETVEQLLPLVATLTCAGILVQIMTLTGVRGLLAVTFVTLPVVAVLATLFIFLPVSEAILMYAAAPVLGVPLVLLFNTIGLNPIIALAGMSVIWPLGDALPPTAIIGRLTVDIVGYHDSYAGFLKSCWIPALAAISLGTLMVVFSKKLAFLTGL